MLVRIPFFCMCDRYKILALTGKEIFANEEIIIGRDRNRCQYIIEDPYISKRHIRVYTVVYENDDLDGTESLVYVEDLSQNGTYWNGSTIGRGNGGYLLSDGDVLRLSRLTTFTFHTVANSSFNPNFDFTREREMEVRSFHFVPAFTIANRNRNFGGTMS